MPPRRELITQIARLSGLDEFQRRFGSVSAADPDSDALSALIDERLDIIASGLVAEAAVSDDVTGRDSAESYLEDRLQALAPFLSIAQENSIRERFKQETSGW